MELQIQNTLNEKKIKKPKELWGTRHTLAALGCWAFAISYAMRFNLSIAIVAMVNPSKSQPALPVFKRDSCPNYDHENTTLLQQELTPILNNLSSSSMINHTSQEDYSTKVRTGYPTFDWNEEEQGIILSSFFWGYIVSQIPGGWLSQRYGGKWPMGLGLFVAAVFALIVPLAAEAGMGYLIAVRVIQGLGEGTTLPAMHSILAKWIPKEELGQLSGYIYAGMALGTALSMIISGQINHHLGWPFVFYITGAAGVLWFIFWTYFIYSTPKSHPRISKEELTYIQESMGEESLELNMAVPWKKVLTSAPFWAVAVGHITETWGLYTIMTELPSYMSSVLHFDMNQNSFMSGFPHLLTWGFSIILTQTCDFLTEKKLLSIGTSRKICNTIALWGSAAALIGVAYSGCNRVITVGLLGICITAMGGLYGGIQIALIDITPNLAGILMGFINTAATVPGFIAPWLAGVILKDNPSLENWRLVFLITAGVSFTGNLIFILFASGSEQSWNRPTKNTNEGSIINENDIITVLNPQHNNHGVLENIEIFDIIFNETKTSTAAIT